MMIKIMIIKIIITIIMNNDNKNLYFTRLTHSNTGFDFSCGPPFMLQTTN